jgi:hypothetical protein
MPRHRKVRRNRTSTCEWEKGVAAAAVVVVKAVEVVGEVPWERLEADKRLRGGDKVPLPE